MSPAIIGLSASEAATRLRAEGPNELPQAERRTWWRVVIEVLREPMFALLIAGGIIYLALGNPREAAVLGVFATLSVSIAVIQDLRSERVLEALRTLASPRALVIRDGVTVRIPGRDVARGDVLLIGEGDRIAADGIVRDTTDLRVDESALTGESVPVTKHAVSSLRLVTPTGDTAARVFAGTLVVGGQATVEVTATGPRSEIGAIGISLKTIQLERPRTEREMRRLVRIWAFVGLAASAGAIVLYASLRGNWLEGLLAGIALGMSMLPEEFPLVLSVFMVMGAWRISKVRVLTRRASAIEYLGAATVLCTDKTGTLTQNRMQLAAVATSETTWLMSAGAPTETGLATIIETAANACPSMTHDPMERAIQAVRFIPAAGAPIHSYPLRPDLMAMSQVWPQADGGTMIASKGAIEAVLQLCRLSGSLAERIRGQAESLAGKGMRVLGVGRTFLPSGQPLPKDHTGMTFDFIGLIGLSDPLREEVPAAIAECHDAGIRVVMVTGDYPATAMAIAREAGIESEGLLAGPTLESMNDLQLREALRKVNVCARITPLQKLRIVNAFKANDDVVAMTGDGVNDAPSLKAADIGIAMGGRGTDVAREASAIVLLDDDFTSVVRTIRLGRRIYDNLRKAISFITTIHILIGGLALIPVALGLPLFLFPIHIAFLEMILDPVCSLAFEAEREESDVMRRPPRPVHQRLFTRAMIIWALIQGIVALGMVLGAYAIALKTGLTEPEARALTFVSLVGINIGLTLINRSFHRRSIVAMLLRDNRTLWLVLGLVLAILFCVLLWAPLRSLFQFGALHVDDLAVAAGISLAFLVLMNIAKRWAPLAHALGPAPGAQQIRS